jgi:hypothetical protein
VVVRKSTSSSNRIVRKRWNGGGVKRVVVAVGTNAPSCVRVRRGGGGVRLAFERWMGGGCCKGVVGNKPLRLVFEQGRGGGQTSPRTREGEDRMVVVKKTPPYRVSADRSDPPPSVSSPRRHHLSRHIPPARHYSIIAAPQV